MMLNRFSLSRHHLLLRHPRPARNATASASSAAAITASWKASPRASDRPLQRDKAVACIQYAQRKIDRQPPARGGRACTHSSCYACLGLAETRVAGMACASKWLGSARMAAKIAGMQRLRRGFAQPLKMQKLWSCFPLWWPL